MRNDTKLGCFGILALCVAVYLLWIAVLYVGIPLAIAGAGVAAYLFKHRADPDLGEADREVRLGAAIVLAIASLLLGSASLAGNIFSNDGPFSHRATTSDTTAQAQTKDDDRVTVTPAECGELRAEPQTTQSIKAMCYRMYPTDGWGDAAGRMVCENDQRKKMEACGVKVFIP